MRLSDLIGREVVDSGGRRVGTTADVVLVQDGPMLNEQSASFRCSGLVVVERRHVRLLGYERDIRPVVLRWLVQALAGQVRTVPWEKVASYDDGPVRLTVGIDALEPHAGRHGR
jgi:sporulation protein YlmC with PRC-barrel domain